LINKIKHKKISSRSSFLLFESLIRELNKISAQITL